MPKVIILDPLSDEGLRILCEVPGLETEQQIGLKGPALQAALAQADAAICRSGVKINAEALEGNTRLRAIVRAGVGTDNIDSEVATRRGILVMNTPTGNTNSTAEHTFALMLALSRNIAPAFASLKQGVWDRKNFTGTQLANKTLGIIGLGRIGQAIAARAKAFEMRVIGFDPWVSPDRVLSMGIEAAASIDDLLPKIDFLTVHTPLTEETRNLISHAQIARMRPGVRLVNCARGGIYDEAALLAGLQSKRIAGVALDVFTTEPCTDSPLFQLPNVLATPHLGASTEEAQAQVAAEAAQILADFFLTGTIRHAVNAIPLDAKKVASLAGYVDVAYRLGLIHGQVLRGSAKNYHLHYRGEVASKDTKLLTAMYAAGLIQNALDEPVNFVNAEQLLRDRGIELVEDRSTEMGAFSSLILAQAESSLGSYRAAGTVFGNRMVRLVQLGDFRLEAYLDGILLIFRHHDVPGIIGNVGTILGRHHVNIAQMSVGRMSDTPGGPAVGVLNLDSLPSQESLKEIKSTRGIDTVDVIQLPPAGYLPSWFVMGSGKGS